MLIQTLIIVFKKSKQLKYSTVCACTLNCFAAAAAKLLQSCPTLCDPIDSSPPGSPASGILQARTLEWLAMSFSNAWKGKVKVKLLSHVWLFATTWTAAYQAPSSMGFSRQEYWSAVPLPWEPVDFSLQTPLSMGFSRQEYWSWLPCPSPGDLPNPGIEPMSFMSPALAGVLLIFITRTLGSHQIVSKNIIYTTRCAELNFSKNSVKLV